jgi:mannose-1-phosphate guanylyltransferase
MAIAGTIYRTSSFGRLSGTPQSDGSKYAAVILAGGDGRRLSFFTRRVFGFHLPKQFCPLFGRETLLERTMRRVSLLVPPRKTLTVLNRAQEIFYAPLFETADFTNTLIQPDNRGTAAAIISALYRLIAIGHNGAVVIFPSDHYVTDDSIFMRHVRAAFRAVEMAPRLSVLLGISADGPKPEYGWIEPGSAVASAPVELAQINRVRRFWDKPAPDIARYLHGRDCLWNSLVLVANAPMLLSLIARTLPEMYRAFSPIKSLADTAGGDQVLRSIFRDLPSADFSTDVLAKFPREFSVLPVTDVSWSDLGDPSSLLAAISHDRDRISGGSQNVSKN